MKMETMKNNEPIYIIEREFLSKFTAVEFVNRIIQNHINNQSEKEVVASSAL